MRVNTIINLALLLLFCSFNGNNNPPVSVIGNTISDFSLANTNGQFTSLSDYKKAKGFIIVFTCNHCPFAKLYPKRLIALSNSYQPLGIPLIAINSMDTISYEEETPYEMLRKAKVEKFNFAYLSDASQKVGKAFGAIRTPQVFVLWKENNKWVIKYSGAIDDNGQHPEKATPFVRNAVEELLRNKAVSTPETPSIGCRIAYSY